jgi:phage terminase large subunit GpA-like protein
VTRFVSPDAIGYAEIGWTTALYIDSISIDSGHHTQAVYHFVRQQQAAALRIHAIKGSSEEGKPIRGAATIYS